MEPPQAQTPGAGEPSCSASHLSIRTEEAYCKWIRRYILFLGTRHPRERGAEEVRSFLSELATEGTVAASTQNQALAALLFCTGTCWSSRSRRSAMSCGPVDRGGSRSSGPGKKRAACSSPARHPHPRSRAAVRFRAAAPGGAAAARQEHGFRRVLPHRARRQRAKGSDHDAVHDIRRTLQRRLQHVHEIHETDLATGQVLSLGSSVDYPCKEFSGRRPPPAGAPPPRAR